MFDFASAYRQLRQSERIFVDGYISEVERYATRNNLKLEQALQEVSYDDLDQRSKDILGQSLVRAAIMERVKEISEDAELSVSKTLKELRSMAYSNLGDYMEFDAFGLPTFSLEKCTPEQLAAIKAIKIREDPSGNRQLEFTLHDKVASMNLMMKYMGLLDQEHWRVEASKAHQQQQITADHSEDDAAELYARAING